MSSTETSSPIELLFSDAWLLAAHKPSGMPVQADKSGDPDLLSVLRTQTGDHAIELAHRIDRPVSGVVLCARNKEALTTINNMFRDRQVKKTYWAIVEGKVEERGEHLLEHVLDRDGRTHKAKVTANVEGEASRTMVKLLATGDRYSLVEARPESGAFHQIRAQLAAWGHAIKGDVKYGARRGEKDRSIALLARSVSFKHHITNKAMVITARPPSGPLWDALLKNVPVEPTPDPRP